MITPTQIALLDVSAASGLVSAGDRLYVVADDDHAVAVYDRMGVRRGTIAVLEAVLPSEPEARKAAKADFEAIAWLPGHRLLVMGSGSAPPRTRMAIVSPGPAGPAAQEIEARPLYEALAAAIPELNLEGAAVLGDRLRLLQRGNGRARQNAAIDLALGPLLDAIERGRPLAGGLIERVIPIDLGDLDGVPITFTDASPVGGGDLVFSAAAEDTDDPYLDGPCAGSILGLLDADGRVVATQQIAGTLKIEGVDAHLDGGTLQALLVADADDPGALAPLLSVRHRFR